MLPHAAPTVVSGKSCRLVAPDLPNAQPMQQHVAKAHQSQGPKGSVLRWEQAHNLLSQEVQPAARARIAACHGQARRPTCITPYPGGASASTVGCLRDAHLGVLHLQTCLRGRFHVADRLNMQRTPLDLSMAHLGQASHGIYSSFSFLGLSQRHLGKIFESITSGITPHPDMGMRLNVSYAWRCCSVGMFRGRPVYNK